jgi:hypothetical protein
MNQTRSPDRRRVWAGVAVPAVALLAAATVTGLRFPPYHDERLYLPLIADYSRGFDAGRIATYRDTQILTGPAMFLTYSVWARLVGLDPARLRTLSAVLAAAAGAGFVAIDARLGGKRPVLVGLAVCALPLFLVTGTTVLSEPLSLAAAALGTTLWLGGAGGRSGSSRCWLSALPLAVAANARAPWLALPLALAVAGAAIVRRPAAAIAPALAIAAQVPLWVVWGGVIPDPGRVADQAAGMGIPAQAGLHPESLLHQLAVAGFAFWPALRVRRAPPRLALPWMLLGIVLYAAFAPDMTFRFGGPLRALAALGGGLMRPLLPAAALCGWALALQVGTDVLDGGRPPAARSLGVAALLGVGIYLASPISFDRYSLTFTPFWLLALAPALGRRPRLWGGWLAAELAVAAGSCAVAWWLLRSPSLPA